LTALSAVLTSGPGLDNCQAPPGQTQLMLELFMASATPTMDAPLERLVRHVVDAMHPL